MTLTFHSQRLTLRPFTTDDLDLSVEMFTDPAVMTYSGKVMDLATIRAMAPRWSRRGADGCIGIWTVVDRDTGEKYGSAALLPMPVERTETDYTLVVPGRMPPGDVEIGYYLKRSAWGRGYATEAARRLLRYAFEASPLHQIVATFDPANLASKRVLEKAGFTDRGTTLCYGKEGVLFRITRREWRARQGPQTHDAPH